MNSTTSSEEEQRPEEGQLAVAELRKQGFEGVALFEKIATRTIKIKEQSRVNRCLDCWHDAKTRCICAHLPSLENNLQQLHLTLSTQSSSNLTTLSQESPSSEQQRTFSKLPVKVLLLMHYKEYLSAGNDAKLLLSMLPKENTQLYIFGKDGDWDKFHDECKIDPAHTVILWPNEDSLTVDDYVSKTLSEDSPWKEHCYSKRRHSTDDDGPRQTTATRSNRRNLPTLRVILLDGVYAQARNMFRAIGKRFDKSVVPPHIALQPKTLSIYHRAQNKYADYSAVTVSKSVNHPDAFHICTVEAFGLLMKELNLDRGAETGREVDGDDDKDCCGPTAPSWTDKLVLAVQINNKALKHCHDVRPPLSAGK